MKNLVVIAIISLISLNVFAEEIEMLGKVEWTEHGYLLAVLIPVIAILAMTLLLSKKK